MNLEPLPNGLVRVTFEWDPRFGQCYECGAPAAYYVPYHDEPVGLLARPAEELATETAKLRCSVCAALAANDGETVAWLFEDIYGV